MTFLQAQLAEAINLQDRSVVAQLHETLRSIRQLPSGRYDSITKIEASCVKRSNTPMPFIANQVPVLAIKRRCLPGSFAGRLQFRIV